MTPCVQCIGAGAAGGACKRRRPGPGDSELQQKLEPEIAGLAASLVTSRCFRREARSGWGPKWEGCLEWQLDPKLFDAAYLPATAGRCGGTTVAAVPAPPPPPTPPPPPVAQTPLPVEAAAAAPAAPGAPSCRRLLPAPDPPLPARPSRPPAALHPATAHSPPSHVRRWELQGAALRGAQQPARTSERGLVAAVAYTQHLAVHWPMQDSNASAVLCLKSHLIHRYPCWGCWRS